MNKEWDRSPLYTGFEDPAYAADPESFKTRVEEFLRLVAA